MPDKFSATWVSHSSLTEFVRCPRAYYLKNVYKDANSHHKVQVVSPPLSLGSAVHEVVESLSILPVEERFSEPLLEKLERIWKKYSGKRGGFTAESIEEQYKERARAMIQRVMAHPGPVARKAIKLKAELPQYWLSEEDEIMLCGKIDWLEYLEETDSVKIVDFKTSKREEDGSSLQLPIYSLLLHNVQRRRIDGASYWYLGFSDELSPQVLPELDAAHEHILKLAKQLKLARKLNLFKCPHGESGCRSCREMEIVVRGDAEYVGIGEYNQDLYLINREVIELGADEDEGVIL